MKAAFEIGGKFALVLITDLLTDLRYRKACGKQKISRLVHSDGTHVIRQILSIDSAEIILEAGLADTKTVCQFLCRMVLTEIFRQKVMGSLGNRDLSFRIKGAGL